MEILRVDMQRLSTKREALPEEYAAWGGRGLVATILNREVDPACAPLGSGNKLVVANGLLAGTLLSSTGRLSVGGKSPLTGGIKESNAGGVAGDMLAKLDLRAIIVESAPAANSLYLLKVGPEKAELFEADEYRGLGTNALAEKLYARFGNRIGLLCIGPAGEHKMALAGVAVNDKDGSPSRYAGRGGMGALMGSKGIKAIVLDHVGGSLPVGDQEALAICRQWYTRILLDHPMTGHHFPDYGTVSSLETVRALGALPVKNFSQGNVDGECPQLTAKAIRETILNRGGEGNTTHACMPGCVIRCSNVYPDPTGKAIVSPFDYENLALLGPNLGILELDEIARLNARCNDIGVDTIEMGVTLGVAMEAGVIHFGDFTGAARLIDEVAEGSILGKVIGQGATIAGRVLGVKRIPACKGQSIPGYDPRGFQGMGVTYSTSAMGADHGAGYVVFARVNHHSPDGQVAISRDAQVLRAAQDNVGVCSFVQTAFGASFDKIIELVNVVQGTHYPPEYWKEIGKAILRLERTFNRRAGITSAHDRAPEFMRTEPLPPFGLTFDVPQEELEHIFDDLLQ